MASSRPAGSLSTLAHGHDQASKDEKKTERNDALLSHLEAGSRRILDLGCGPGRDLCTFRDLGHEAVGLDGAARFVDMTRRHTGGEVLHQDFLALDLPAAHFDGVFANASLASSSWNTTTAPQACRAHSSRGLRRCGARRSDAPRALIRRLRSSYCRTAEATMGDKSPKSKQRGQKQKDTAKAESAAAAKFKQDSQSQQTPAKGKR